MHGGRLATYMHRARADQLLFFILTTRPTAGAGLLSQHRTERVSSAATMGRAETLGHVEHSAHGLSFWARPISIRHTPAQRHTGSKTKPIYPREPSKSVTLVLSTPDFMF